MGILNEKMPLSALATKSIVTHSRMSQNIKKHQFKIEDNRRIMKTPDEEPELQNYI